METQKLVHCCDFAKMTPSLPDECKAVAMDVNTKSDQKEKYEAMACLDECFLKLHGGLADDGNLKKEVVLAFVTEKMKEYPDFIESSKNVTESCVDKGLKI